MRKKNITIDGDAIWDFVAVVLEARKWQEAGEPPLGLAGHVMITMGMEAFENFAIYAVPFFCDWKDRELDYPINSILLAALDEATEVVAEANGGRENA